MNDDETNPQPQPWIDPALEARIVAGVLGEASAFEAAELERAVAENPELAIFKRRIEAVHDLVGAAVRPEKPRLQLSPERRGKLLATIGVSPAEPRNKAAIFTLPPPAWWSSSALIRIAACLVIGAIFVTFFSSVVLVKSPSESPDFLAFGSEGIDFIGNDLVIPMEADSVLVATSPMGFAAVPSNRQGAAAQPTSLNFPLIGTAPVPSTREDAASATPVATPQEFAKNAALAKEAMSFAKLPESHAAPSAMIASLDSAEKPQAMKELQPPSGPSAEDRWAAPAIKRKGNDGTLLGSAPTPSSTPAAVSDEMLPEQTASSIRVFTGAWGKSSQAGAREAKDDAPKDQQFADAAPANDWDDVSRLEPITALAKNDSDGRMQAAGSASALGDILRAEQESRNFYKQTDSQVRPNEEVTANVINQPIFTAQNEVVKFDGGIDYGSPITTDAPAKAAESGQTGKLLEEAKDFSDSGRFDLATKRYEQALNVDPTNIEARQGIDRVSAERDKSLGHAVNETRSRMLWSVANGWELPVRRSPSGNAAVLEQSNADARGTAAINRKLDEIIIPKVEFRDATVSEVVAFLEQRSKAMDTGDKDAENRGINLVLKQPSDSAKSEAKISLNLTDVPVRQALRYLAKLADLKVKVEPFAVEVSPLSETTQPIPKIKSPQPASPDEIQTAQQPFSTFSLHISDVSFQLAKDALAKGTVPDPARIRAEEFYNAFDYNDPAPAIGEPVAARIEQSAHPFRQQRDLVRIALKVAAAGRAAGQPLRLTILLDTSGSMEREDRAASVRRALQSLATLLGPQDRVTLIGFARTPRLLAEQLSGDQAAKLVEMAARTPSEGGTNLESALALASEMALKQKLPAAQNRIVLLTDGAANLGNADPARLAKQIESTRQQGISFDACGVGANGLNDEMLEALTRKGDGRYYFINKPDDADAGFARQLAGALRPAAENVKVQVVFNPARVSQYRLIGFENHLLKKEDFRNDKVQAAELSAEEAGVALYQVETLPEGEGDLGQVFVRFRDPATGAMVERSWPMPFEAKARPFDQASPSMQLATTAALLAEKLRGDSSVDLNALAPTINTLRRHYPNQARVNELIQMVERLRVTKP